MKTINLEKIKEKYGSIGIETCEGYQHEHIIEAMKEACEQTVDLCAENLRKWLESDDDSLSTSRNTILNTKNQIV